MINNMYKIEGELLVECLYATAYNVESNSLSREHGAGISSDYWKEQCNPYMDTLDSRRQLDALIDYFKNIKGGGYLPLHSYEFFQRSVWALSSFERDLDSDYVFTYNVNRVKWCCEQSIIC